MSQYLSKVITIEAISDKQDKPTAAVKGNDGNWYSTFRSWQGEMKDAYNQLLHGNHNEPFKKGDVALISYKEEAYNGKIQYKLMSIFPSDQAPAPSTPPQTESPRYEAATASQGASGRGSNDAFGRRLALHGMVNGVLAAGIPPKEVKKLLPDLVELEDEIEAALAFTPEPTAMDSDLPQEAPQDDLNVEDIPF